MAGACGQRTRGGSGVDCGPAGVRQSAVAHRFQRPGHPRTALKARQASAAELVRFPPKARYHAWRKNMPHTSVAEAAPVAPRYAPVHDAWPLTVTVDLLARAKHGDARATEQLFERCSPLLVRWAHGRLPSYARDLANTQDIVQDALVSMLNHLDRFEPRHPGALLAFLRQVVTNRIRDEIRRIVRRPVATELDSQHLDPGPLPLEIAMYREGMEHYQT